MLQINTSEETVTIQKNSGSIFKIGLRSINLTYDTTTLYIKRNSQTLYKEIFSNGIFINGEEVNRTNVNEKTEVLFKEGGVNPPTPKEISVRFISPIDMGGDNYLIEEIKLNKDDDIPSFPNPPILNRLIFSGWTHTPEDISNLNNDTKIVALYRKTDNETISSITLDSTTGLTVPVAMQLDEGVILNVAWGDGSLEDVNIGDINHTYESYGTYEIRISKKTGEGSYKLGGGTINDVFIGKSTDSTKKSLTKIEVGNNVKLNNYAFSKCTSLTSVILPEGLTELANGLFYMCSSLKGIIIPESVTNVGNSVFNGCSSIRFAVFPKNLTSIGYGIFENCTSLSSVVLPDNLTSIGNSVFSSCTSLKSITLPASITSIGNMAFRSCPITTLDLPNGIISLGENVFTFCRSLLFINFPETLKSLGTSCFSSCTSLKSVVIPESITEIPTNCFVSCSSVLSVILPKTIIKIWTAAFSGCISCEEYIIYAETPPTLLNINVFDKINDSCKIYVPDGSVDMYKKATNWVNLASKIYPISEYTN